MLSKIPGKKFIIFYPTLSIESSSQSRSFKTPKFKAIKQKKKKNTT